MAAEEISPPVARVCRFLRQEHGVDVNCVQFNIFQTESGEVLVNSENIVGLEDVVTSKKVVNSNRWNGDKPVKQVVREGVEKFTKDDVEKIFSAKDIYQLILEEYPTFKQGTVGCQIMSDCVNHTSRHHYPGGEDLYWWKEKGKYTLYETSRN